MKRPFATTLLLTACAVGTVMPAATVIADLIPRSTFFGNPDRAAVRISPGGDRLSYLAPHENVLNIWIKTIDQSDDMVITNSTHRPIRRYLWAENNEQILYLQDTDGDEDWHVYAVDLETGEQRDLTPFDQVNCSILATDRDHPDNVLVTINQRDPRWHDVYRIDTRTGESEMVFENTERFVGFIADSDLVVRIGYKYNERGGIEASIRDDADGEWYELARWDFEDSLNSRPLGFTQDGRTLYIADSRGTDTTALYAFQLNGTNGPSYQKLSSNQRADLAGIVADPRTGRVQAVAYEYDRQEWDILDSTIRKDWEYLQGVTDGELSITSRSNDDSTWIVSYVRDNGPVEYYLYNRGERQAEFLFTNRSELEGLTLAKMEPVVITARDGLKLVSYLTTPVDKAARDLPMVLLVHGGPWARDTWGYNSLHQWLANRGYAVLSVNFRGSTGFGKAFINAGNREWAGAMHNDLIDAVNWAVTEGIADPDRVAIMGGSYGGYATLVGLTFTPEFFAAGVDIVGPSHVSTLLQTIPPYWSGVKVLFDTRVGSLDEQAYLDSISPLTRVDQIIRPLLIGQGANDPRVKKSESQQIVDAMQSRNIPVTYVLFPDEGHGFARPINNLAFFAITEGFLAEHLGGEFQPITSEVRESSAEIPIGAGLIPGLAEATP